MKIVRYLGQARIIEGAQPADLGVRSLYPLSGWRGTTDDPRSVARRVDAERG